MSHIFISLEEFLKKTEEWIIEHIGAEHTYNSVKASILNLQNKFQGNIVERPSVMDSIGVGSVGITPGEEASVQPIVSENAQNTDTELTETLQTENNSN